MTDAEVAASLAEQAPSALPSRPGENASSVKRAYLAHLRHELRTPINAILGYSEMLIEDAEADGDASVAADLRKIHTAGSQLLDLVNRVLDPVRLEADLHATEIADVEQRLRHDLLTPINAVIGYTELLREEAEEEDREHLSADLRKINGAANRLLALINDLVGLSTLDDAQLADAAPLISAEARATMNTLEPAVTPPAADPAIANARVLVVDDNATNRDLLTRRLTRQGFIVVAADNGRRALELIAAEDFDLVLLDVMMPELNGIEVLQRLKADPRLRALPVIMISALDEVESVVRCIEIGAEDYLPKPCNPTLLQARIGSSLEKKRLRDREQAFLEQLRVERERAERLLLNVLPRPIAERLGAGETEIADSFSEATVLFSDLVGFTGIAARVGPVELVRWLNRIFSDFDRLAERYGLEKIKTIGDSYMVVGGIPSARADHAEAIAEMALDMVEVVNRYATEWEDEVRIRVGIHSGPVVAGVIGTKKFAYDLWGDTVNVASRMESHGLAGAIQVSEATYARLSGRYRFEERGTIQMKGKGEARTYLLVGRGSVSGASHQENAR